MLFRSGLAVIAGAIVAVASVLAACLVYLLGDHEPKPAQNKVRATTPMFTFKTAMLFWLVAASVPLLTSLVYFRASPSTESLIQRIAVSLHGVAISALCVGAVLVGMLGAPRPELGDIFRFLLFVPITLVIYSFWRFQGKRSIHLLQGINLLWLALAFFFGGMAVTGVWL